LIHNTAQIAHEVKALFSRWLEGNGTDADRDFVLQELRKLGVPVQTYDFSNILVPGTSRRDAINRLLELTFRKAFDILRIEFGSVARFQSMPEAAIDFYWRKANLAVTISGPLTTSPFQNIGNDRLKRAPKQSLVMLARSIGRASGMMRAEVDELQVPYYKVWHNPQSFVVEIKTKLVASGAYPRLNASSLAQA
jgi:hypothetical protein